MVDGKLAARNLLGIQASVLAVVLSFVWIFVVVIFYRWTINWKRQKHPHAHLITNSYTSHINFITRERKAYMLRIPKIASCVSTNLEHGTHSHWFHQTNKTASSSASLSKRAMKKRKKKNCFARLLIKWAWPQASHKWAEQMYQCFRWIQTDIRNHIIISWCFFSISISFFLAALI